MNSLRAFLVLAATSTAVQAATTSLATPRQASESNASTKVSVGKNTPPLIALPFILMMASEYTWLRVSPDPPPDPVIPRKPGDALLVNLRIDHSQQHMNDNTRAFDTRLEAGHGPWAVQGRETRYKNANVPEASTDNTLKLRQLHLLYRMAAGNHAELSLGYGRLQMIGKDTHTGQSATIPLLIHPSPYWGAEYRLTLSRIRNNTLRDQELALQFGLPYASLRIGYRRLESNVTQNGKQLVGPFAGLSIRY